MNTRIFIAFFAAAVVAGTPACRLLLPDNAASELSRRDAIGIFAGGIAESEFLSRTGTRPKAVSAMENMFAIELGDGELFYRVETLGGERRVSEVLLPTAEDVPEELRAYAASFKKKTAKNPGGKKTPARAEETLIFTLSADGAILRGERKISLDELANEFAKIGELDVAEQPKILVRATPEVSAKTLSAILNFADNTGVKRLEISF